MLSTAIPTKFPIPFADSAGAGFITTPIPTAPQPNGRASLQTGFSELNFDPLAAGGIPPWGKDFNGLLKQITAWLQFAAAGGLPVGYDATFQTAINGYPKWALIKRASGDRFWLSTTENNMTDPDTGGAGWSAFPDVIVQQQFGNFAVDTGTANSYAITLDPAPSSLAALLGSPIRVMVGTAGPNTTNNPVIRINGKDPLIMVNSSGTPLLIGQISRTGQIFEGYNDGTGYFQVTSPGPFVSPSGGGFVTGVIYLWATEIAPAGTLECDGRTLLCSDFPNLFNRIGFRYGGNNADRFNLPDLRGAFPRGWDHGRGLDPNASSRTNRGDGTVGDYVGTWQAQGLNAASLSGTRVRLVGEPNPFQPPGIPASTLPLKQELVGSDQYAEQVDLWTVSMGGSQTGFQPGTQPGGVNPVMQVCYAIDGRIMVTAGATETRPVNINMMYIIAY